VCSLSHRAVELPQRGLGEVSQSHPVEEVAEGDPDAGLPLDHRHELDGHQRVETELDERLLGVDALGGRLEHAPDRAGEPALEDAGAVGRGNGVELGAEVSGLPIGHGACDGRIILRRRLGETKRSPRAGDERLPVDARHHGVPGVRVEQGVQLARR
jgi:hypothetical protein